MPEIVSGCRRDSQMFREIGRKTAISGELICGLMRAAEKIVYSVIPSDARNPYGIESQANKVGFLTSLGMSRVEGEEMTGNDPFTWISY